MLVQERSGSWKKQLVIPSKFRSEVLAAAHENVLGGHFGISKTMKKIKKFYYWPTLKKGVVKFCKICHFVKSRVSPIKRFLQLHCTQFQ